MDLRKRKDHQRLFLRVSKKQNGDDSIYNQPIGINTIGGFPYEIARYLNLPYSTQYTGHTFRRTAATLVAEEGGSLLQIKRLGGWKGNQVVEGYIDSTTRNQIQIANLISNDQNGKQIQNPQTEGISQNKDSNTAKEVEELERILSPNDFEYMIEKILSTNTNPTLELTKTPENPQRTSPNETLPIDHIYDHSSMNMSDQSSIDQTNKVYHYEVVDTSKEEPIINNSNLMFEDSVSLTPLSSPNFRPNRSPTNSPQESPFHSPYHFQSPCHSPSQSPRRKSPFSKLNHSRSNDSKLRSDEIDSSQNKQNDEMKTFNIKKCKNFTFNIYSSKNN